MLGLKALFWCGHWSKPPRQPQHETLVNRLPTTSIWGAGRRCLGNFAAHSKSKHFLHIPQFPFSHISLLHSTISTDNQISPITHNMSVVSPLSEQMGPLLAKYTPEQIAEFVDTVMKMQPAAPPAAATPEPKKRSRRMAATSKVAQKAVVAPSHTSNNIAPRRPVNSWMAFRSELEFCL